jgi:hypothetical protein
MTRLTDYDQCPLMAKLKHLDKLCPLCFKGRIQGGYDTPAVCDKCGQTIIKGEPLVRGTALGKSLEDYVNGTLPRKLKRLDATYQVEGGNEKEASITHPQVMKLADELRADHKKKKVKVEMQVNLDRNWKILPPKWSPAIWLIVKLDVYRLLDKTVARVIDWKSGGIDKRTGKPRDDDKYAEQLEIYSVAVLSIFPEVERTSSALCFVDTAAKHDPLIEKPQGCIERKDLAKRQRAWEKRVLPIMNDTSFVARANDKCSWCNYSKGSGGPCKY